MQGVGSVLIQDEVRSRADTRSVDAQREGEAGKRRRLPHAAWFVPLLVAAAVAATAALASAEPAASSPTLPTRTPTQLIAAIQSSAGTPLTGDVRDVLKLGLPSLPGDSSVASLNWQTFVTGSHSARVWVNGTSQQRLALIGELSEAEVVHNGRNVWTYTSDTNTATHSVLPADARDTIGTDLPLTPADAAARVITAISPSTSVRVGTSTTVAGRAAYTLVFSPRDRQSTISDVTVAVDSTRFVPLRVQVFTSSSRPAVEIGFTKISYARPPASTFRFTVPDGAAISANPLVERQADRNRHEPTNVKHRTVQPAGAREPSSRVIGTGWTQVVELPRGANAAGGFPIAMSRVTTRIGTSGARLFHTALINAVVTSDGRIFVGAVQPTFVEHVAATTAD